MPPLQNLVASCSDGSANHTQFVGAKPVAPSQRDRFEPELAGAVLALDMNVCRFIAVEAGEEEPVRPRDPLDSRHSGTSFPLTVNPASTNSTREIHGARCRES